MSKENNDVCINGPVSEDAKVVVPLEIPDSDKFLFTSESVGEGHPGKMKQQSIQVKDMRWPLGYVCIGNYCVVS